MKPDDKYHFDGLNPACWLRCWEATQEMAYNVQPYLPEHKTQHDIQHLDEGDQRLMDYRKNGRPCQEHRGTYHFVQGWIQQGQVKKGLYLLKDSVKTLTAAVAVRRHYDATYYLALQLKAILKVLLPEEFERYQKGFDAGAWHEDVDPGPFLGRAVIWKMQLSVHKDGNDTGFSISFPFGEFSGGHMLIPQLGVKLNYAPGDLCIFLSSDLYHCLTPWDVKPELSQDKKYLHLTPG